MGLRRVASRLLSGSFRHLCRNRGRLLGCGFLDGRALLRRLCLHSRSLRRLNLPERRPTFLRGRDDSLHPLFTDAAFDLPHLLGGLLRRLRFALGLRPSPLLGFLHVPSSGSGEFLALPGCGCWRGSELGGATGQHGSDFSNLGINALFLCFESNKGSVEDFGGECARSLHMGSIVTETIVVVRSKPQDMTCTASLRTHPHPPITDTVRRYFSGSQSTGISSSKNRFSTNRKP
jgi:hypothetical protein